MKIGGKKLDKPNEEIIAIPRGVGGADDIIFKAQAILDYSDFEKLCPVPQAPLIRRPGGVTSINVEDKKYQASLEKFARLRTHWLILKSLSATPGLEWETIDFSNPDTWENYLKELRESMLTEAEITRIIQAVMSANSLDDSKIEEARKRFLARAPGQDESISQKDEQEITPLGEPANA